MGTPHGDPALSNAYPSREATAGQVIECKSCGAVLDVGPELRTVRCAYCASSSIVTRPITADRPHPVFALGFVITREQAIDMARQWVRRPLLAPQAFRNAAPRDIWGVYIPAYLYSATIHSQYRANIGEHYMEEERYMTTDSQGKRVERIRYHKRTEWHVLAGSHAAYVSDKVVTASRGIPNHELEAVEPFDLLALHRYTPKLISGWTAEEPSLSVAECLELARGEALQEIGARLRGFMPGDVHRDLEYGSNASQESLSLTLLPIWILAVKYDDKKPIVRLLVNGQTGRVHGRAPTSGLKVTLIVLLLVVTGCVAYLLLKG